MKTFLLPKAEPFYLANYDFKLPDHKTKQTVISVLYVVFMLAALASFFIYLPGFMLFIGAMFVLVGFDDRVSGTADITVFGRRVDNNLEKKYISLGVGAAVVFVLTMMIVPFKWAFACIIAVAAVAFYLCCVRPLMKAFAAVGRRRRCTEPVRADFFQNIMVPCGKCDTEKAAAYLYTYTYMNEKYMFVLNVAEGARTGYSRSLDIMIDPMHPEEYFSNMLFSADVGKKIGRSVIFLILAAFCAAIIYLGHSFERYSAEHFTAIHYDYLDS